MASPIKSARNLARKRGVFVVCGAIAVVFLALVIAAMAFAGPPIPPVPQGNVQFRWMGDRAVYMRIASSAFSLWGVSAYLRCLDRKNRIYLAGIAIFLVFWMLDAIIKWKTHSLWLGIFCWYFYYVPMTVIPLLTLLIGGRAAGLDRSPAARNIKNGLIALACALIVLVFSNNLHQLVFSFDSPNPGVVGEYEYRGGYWLFMI
ncbi:histidine kinase N-terminal 7TM domain-containing protein [Parolsenella catena]|nr:histidine kinase N-terminal 7TM domain-containing protein [Parolsenella catena]